MLKLLSAGVCRLQPASALATAGKLTNWAGNLSYATDRLESAASVDEVAKLVRAQPRLKVLGSRHCFNSIADSRHLLLSLKPMHGVGQVDRAAQTVTVEAGITYGDLAPQLDKQGFALHNLASLPHISIAGACATATHGSGEGNGNLATAVAAVEMVTAAGDTVQFTPGGGKDFAGVVVGLGALGVVTRVTLRVQPRYTVRQYVYENLPLAQMRDHFDAIQASGYSVSLFTDWQKQRLNEVWIKTRSTAGAPEFAAPAEFYGATLAKRDLHPIAELSAENCTRQMGLPGPWFDRLPHFRMGFTPSAGKELQSEYFVPRGRAVDAILAIERLRDQITPHLLISEIRTIAADELWMSPCYRRPSIAIHFTWKQDWPAVSRLLPKIEHVLEPFGVKPHWGKLFTVPASTLAARYPKMNDFKKLAAEFDPSGKFKNDFLMKNIFA